MSKISNATDRILHHYLNDGGLLHALRPYTGVVEPNSLAEVLDAVRVLKDEAESGKVIPVSSLALVFRVTHDVRRIALDKDGMLVRNGRIAPPEWDMLMNWVIEVEEEFAALWGILEDRER